MAAGNKDLKVIGEPDPSELGLLHDIPKFTPLNCNFFKQTISAAETAGRLEQSGKRERGQNRELRLTSDKANPVYDKRR